MNSFWKEYGVIALLIVIAVGGYLLFDRNREDILSYSLDAVGTRLVALVDDDVSKRRIALAFDSFKRRVANDEVSPEQVELVAANILNLSTSGARITPEDAELILNLNEEALLADLPVPEPAPEPEIPAPPSSATAPRAVDPVPPPVASGDARALASRIEAMVGVARTIERSGRHDIRIDVESIRAAAETAVRATETGRSASAASESGTTVRVDEMMAGQQDAWARFAEHRHREMAEFERTFDVRSADLARSMERLEQLTSLQDKGLYAPFDTTRFGLRLDELMKRLRQEAVKGTTSETPPTDSDN